MTKISVVCDRCKREEFIQLNNDLFKELFGTNDFCGGSGTLQEQHAQQQQRQAASIAMDVLNEAEWRFWDSRLLCKTCWAKLDATRKTISQIRTSTLDDFWANKE